MKRMLGICCLLLLLFCGCRSTESASFEELSKAQEIAVLSAKTDEVLWEMTDPADVEAWIEALAFEEWSLADLPEEAAPIGRFELRQQKTVKFGQQKADDTLYPIGTITLYPSDVLSLQVLGTEWTFEISSDTSKTLSSYFAED